MQAGAQIAPSARAEGIHPSTLFRALKRPREDNPGRFVIVGAGGLGRELAQWITKSLRPEGVVFLDDKRKGPHILGNIDSYSREPGDEVFIAIGDPQERAAIADRFSRLGAAFVATDAMTGNCSIGPGTMVFPRALVSADVVLGSGCVVNAFASIGHDVRIGDFVTLSSHVDICGRVKIGNRVMFGSGSRVIPDVVIGDDVTVGAGAVVVKDVPSGSSVFGNPARAVG